MYFKLERDEQEKFFAMVYCWDAIFLFFSSVYADKYKSFQIGIT